MLRSGAGRTTPDQDRPGGESGRRDLLRGRWPWALGTMAFSLAAVIQVQVGSWTGGLFLDEQWRADMARSAQPWDRMLTHDTPIPIGWLYLTKVVAAVTGGSPVALRVWTAACYVLAAGVLTLFALRLAERGPTPPPGRRLVEWRVVPSAAVALMACVPAIAHWYHYFNNYTFEVLYTAALLLAAGEVGRTRRAATWCAGLVAAAPLFVLGGLFLLPGIVVTAAVAAGRSGRRAVAAGATGGVVIAAVSWWTLYRPIGSKPSISAFWINERASLGGDDSLPTLLGASAHQLAEGVASFGLEQAGGVVWDLARMGVAAAAVAGVVAVARRWPWLLLVQGVAYAATVAASAAVHWPMTVERVNLALTSTVVFLILFGAGRAIAVLSRGNVAIAGLAVVALVELVWPAPWGIEDNAYSRTAVADLQVVADSPASRNVVITYHHLLHWYTHDVLVNTSHGDRTFELDWETLDRPDHLYTDLDAVLAAKDLRPGDMVWCVFSYWNGARNHDACQFRSVPVTKVVDRGGEQVIVQGYRVVGAAGPGT